MLERSLSAVATLVTERRRLILLILLGVTVLLGVQLRHLHADPSPSALLSSAGQDGLADAEAFRKHFGSTDSVVALLLQSEDLYSPESLSYLYQLGEALAAMPGVERVDSIGRIPLPAPQGKATDGEEGPTLDDLDAEDDSGDDGLTLEDLDTEDADTDPSEDPELREALIDIVGAAPDVFPMGLATLSERMGDRQQEVGPLLTSADVTPEQALNLRQAVADTPALMGRLVSRDGTAALLAAVFDDGDLSYAELKKQVAGVETWLADHAPPAGMKVHLGGLPVLRTTMIRHMRRDQMVLIPGTVLVCILVLILSFRWLPGVILPVGVVGLATIWVLGGMGLAGEPLNVVNNVLPPLLIIIGISDSIHLIGRYRDEFAHSHQRLASLKETVLHIGGACLMTSLTTAAGLFSLFVSRTQMLASFGVIGAIGVMLAYVATLLFLPAALMGMSEPPKPPAASRSALEHGIFVLTAKVIRQPYRILGAALLFTLAAGYVASGIRVDSALLDQFQDDDPMSATTHLLERKFDGIRPLEVALDSDQDDRFWQPEVLVDLHAVATWVAGQPGVLSVTDPTDHLTQAWNALSGRDDTPKQALRNVEQVKGLDKLFDQRAPNPLRAFVTADGRHARLRIKLADNGSRATLKLTRELRRQLDRRFGPREDIEHGFTGDAYVSSYGLDAVVTDLASSLAMAIVVIFLLLTVLFRSVRLGLLSIPPNLIPLVLAMAWMVVRDIPLNAATCIIFSISIGLAVDGSIHVLSRFLEERDIKGHSVSTAILRAARSTGRAILISGAALVLGFSVLLFSNFVPVQRFSELIGVSVVGCLVATLVVQPALLRFAGPGRKSSQKSATGG